ncbi:MAG: hypothetical protein PUC05_02890 [Firmicutes bacterium]|nr:hypothetical protein [Bacillota bacterium]
MKFKLVESLEDIQADYTNKKEQLEEIKKFFYDADFLEYTKPNGIAFEKNLEEEENSYKAQFYIDTTAYTYSCYITTDTTASQVSYSSKGDFSNLLPAVSRFLDELNKI